MDDSEDSNQEIPDTLKMIYVVAGRFAPRFNPMTDVIAVLSLPFDTLIEIHPMTGEIRPSIAKQWIVSNNSKHYVFYLHENIMCHDGSILNAHAVKATYDAIINESNERYRANGQFNFIPLESIEILDDYIIKFNFETPYSAFFKVIASHVRIEAITRTLNESQISEFSYYWPVGSGPYELQSVTDEGTFFNYTFKRFTNYFRGLPPFKHLQYLLYTNQTNAAEAIIAEKGDTAPYLSSVLNSSDINENYWQYYSYPRSLHYGFLNHNFVELSNHKVRKALNYAIDKESIIEQLDTDKFTEFFYAKDFILDNTLKNNHTNSAFPYNPEEANKLLDEAGYLRNPDGYRFSLTVRGVYWMERYILLILPYLDAIGINCTYVPTTEHDWWGVFYSGDFDIFFVGFYFYWDWIFSAYDLFHSDGLSNTAGTSDDIIDYYITKGLTTPVKQEKQHYAEVVAHLLFSYTPLILLTESTHGCLKTNAVSSYVWFDPVPYDGIYFNYSTPQTHFQSRFENIEIDRESIYFPSADGLISTEDKLTVTVELSRELSAFLPNKNETGKFYRISVSNSTSEYTLRCYYDYEELEALHPENLTLNQWDENRNSWKGIELVESNIELQYVEAKLHGNIIIRLGEEMEESIYIITHYLLPGVTLIIGILVIIATASILSNNKFTKYFKEEFDLK